jgi:uncharacterized protein YjbI with pentapeptide repeats
MSIPRGNDLIEHAKLTGTRFHDVCLGDAEFENVSLVRVKLHDVNFSEAHVSRFRMGGSKFVDGGSGCAAGQAPITFERCGLGGLRVRDCDLSNASIDGCKLDGLRINGLLLSELLKAYGEGKSQMPTVR